MQTSTSVTLSSDCHRPPLAPLLPLHPVLGGRSGARSRRRGCWEGYLYHGGRLSHGPAMTAGRTGGGHTECRGESVVT